MRYWVYGVDGVSREPREPLFIEAASEEDARAQAKELGMAAEEVEAVQPKTASPAAPASGTPQQVSRSEGDPSETDHPLTRVLVIVFRVLAGIVSLLYVVLLMMTLDAATKAEEMANRLGHPVQVPIGSAFLRVLLEGVLVVALLLAVSEFLRLGMALERNTRGRARGEKRRPQ